MKKIGVVLIFSIIFLLIAGLWGCNDDYSTSNKSNETLLEEYRHDEYISTVREGVLFYDKRYEIGEAFECFFAKPTWDYFRDDNSNDVVEFNGKFYLYGKETSCKIRFKITSKSQFEVIVVAFDNIPQNDQMQCELFEEIFKNAEKKIDKNIY